MKISLLFTAAVLRAALAFARPPGSVFHFFTWKPPGPDDGIIELRKSSTLVEMLNFSSSRSLPNAQQLSKPRLPTTQRQKHH